MDDFCDLTSNISSNMGSKPLPQRKGDRLRCILAIGITIDMVDSRFTRDKPHRFGRGSAKYIPVVANTGLRANDVTETTRIIVVICRLKRPGFSSYLC